MELQERIGTDYIVERLLGSGSTGKVKLARRISTGELVAIKIIKKSIYESKPNIKEKIQREVAVMRVFKHSRLLKLLEICESPHRIYLVLEYASNGELFDYLAARGHLSEEEAMHFFRQIIYGIEFLHSRSICHRDIKPENLLLDEHDNVKIADFGFARIANSDPLTSFCGSVNYAAPEIVSGIPYNGFPADVWSCGVVLYTLLTGRLPFKDPAYRRTIEKIKSGHFVMPDVQDSIKELLASILQVEPSMRLTCEQIKKHPAFRIGLPSDYILPQPLPIPFYEDPIPLEEIANPTLLTLAQLGFSSKEDLEIQLQSPGSNMAKVLYHMLISQESVEALPWAYPDASTFVSPMDGFVIQSPQAFGQLSVDSLGRRRRTGFDASSPDVFSLAERAKWGNCLTTDYPIDVVQPFVEIQLPPEVILAHMQMLLTSNGYQWFHPDDQNIISRRLEDMATIIVTIDFGQNNRITMNLSYSNISQNEIVAFNDAVLQMLSEF